MQKVNIRPNIRYDRADGIDMAFRPFDGRKDQFLFSLDAPSPSKHAPAKFGKPSEDAKCF